MLPLDLPHRTDSLRAALRAVARWMPAAAGTVLRTGVCAPRAHGSGNFRHVQKVNCRKAARDTALGRAAAKMIEIFFAAKGRNSAKPHEI